MAKNITILEGRETRTFGNVEKLQTNLVGGGTQNWIPEDEAASYVDADVLEVDENGYYEPEAGSFYNGVDVNVEVEPDLEEITITENGIYTPSGDGFSQVSVEVEEGGGGGDDPAVHGNEVSAIAQTDINAGDTVAVQDDSYEPVSVDCPLPERLFDQYGNASALKFDGKNIYWVKYIDPYTREVRKKPISRIESEQYTVVDTIGSGWGGIEPWYVKGQAEDSQGTYQIAKSVFTNKELKAYIQGAQGLQFMSIGKCVGEVLTNATYDKALKKVNEGYLANNYFTCRHISGARAIFAGTSGGFAIALNGGITTYYNAIKPSGIDTLAGWGFAMFAGNNAICIGYDSNNPTHKSIIAYPFDESEYEEPRETEGNVICSLDFTSYAVGSDTTFDRWAIATDNGLIIIRSDLSYTIYDAIKSTTTPYIIGNYVFLGAACYQLVSDNAIMIPTSSKGTEGQLGVAKHNVRAGEEGTAIILFS